MQLRPGRFSIYDGGGDAALGPYNGYTTGQTWNGWAMPYFTKDVADQLAAHWNHDPSNGMGCTYDATSDTYTFEDRQNDMEPDAYTGEDHLIDGQRIRLYPIGNGCWVWDEDDPSFDPNWCDYVVRIDETTGTVLEAWKGEAWHDDHTGTTQWRVSMAHGADDAGHRALAMRAQLAHVRKGDA